MELRFVFFLAVMSALVVAGHVYFYRRLVRDTVGHRRARIAGMALVAFLAVLLVGGRFLHRLWPNPVTQLVGDAAYVWMGLALFLSLALFSFGLARWVADREQRLRGAGPEAATESEAGVESALAARMQAALGAGSGGEAPSDVRAEPAVDEGRRLFLSRSVAGGALAVAGGVGGYGAWRAYHEPVITELAVKLRGLPKALDGISIVHLTDIHVGNLIERRFMDELVRRANALKPDLVAVTGDLVDGDVPVLGPAVAALADLKTRYGTYFCNGNHEYYSGDLAWNAYLESIGVTPLRNRHVTVGDAGASFDLVGVDDWSMRGRGRGYDLERAVAGRDPERPAVLLAHQPANFEQAVGKGVGLQLSGHTHGGQLFPFTLLVGLQWAHVAGHYTHGDGHLYVGRGCGFWGPPMRVGSPPELVRVVLTA